MIYCIVGPSGSGKTTASLFASKALGIKCICSYTTRPMRQGETDGVDHWFVSINEMPPRNSMVGYAHFGDYDYWTEPSQFDGDCIYVIDEDGIRFMQERGFDFVAIYVNRKSGNVDKTRETRDNKRTALPDSVYAAIIENDSTLESLEYRLTREIQCLMAKQ